jgi:hypothetical protein
MTNKLELLAGSVAIPGVLLLFVSPFWMIWFDFMHGLKALATALLLCFWGFLLFEIEEET